MHGSTHAHSPLHALHSLLGCIEHEEDEGYEVTSALCLLDEFDIGTCGQSGLKGKGLSLLEQVDDTVYHESACLYGHPFGIEGRESCRYLVSIDKLSAFKHFGKHGKRSGGLASSVASRNDIKIHISLLHNCIVI